MSLAMENYLIYSSIYILLCWAIYLPYRCGQIYLAPVYSMAVGAYFAAYSAREWSFPFALAFLGAAAAGSISALLPAYGLRKASGFTVAVVSFGLIFIIQTVILNLKFLGANAGFFDIPWIENILPITIGLVVVVGVIVHRLDKSYLGRAAETLFYSRDLGASLGMSMSHISILLQAVSGAISGLAGAVFAFAVGSVFPDAFSFSLLLSLCCYLFVGGTFTMWGAVIFAPLLWGVPLILPNAISVWRNVIFGVLLVTILVIRPEGVVTKVTVRKFHQTVLSLFNLIKGKRREVNSGS